MKTDRDEDLFADSTMTFGEHLEELRYCLIRALAGLVVGFLIGLAVARPVVLMIQRPLVKALKEHYKDRAIDEWPTLGIASDIPEAEAVPLIQDNLLPEQVYIDWSALFHQLKSDNPETFADVDLPPAASLRRDSRFGPTHILAEDIVDAEALCRRLAAAGQPGAAGPQAHVWAQLSADGRQHVTAWATKKQLAPDERTSLAALLDGVLADQSLASSPAMADVALSSEGQRLRSRADDLSEPEVARLERLLLEATFDGQIVRSHQALMPLLIWRDLKDDPRVQTKSLGTQEPFFVFIKAALVAGLVISSPWVFYWLWIFVAAGLYPHEKNYVYIFLPMSLGMFLAGASLAFFFVFEPVLKFLFYFNDLLNISPEPRINEWLGLVLLLPIGFGISFQLPLVMLFLERVGIFTIDTYMQNIRIAILVMAVLSMLLTPADPQSMLLMLVPLVILYFLGILLCRLMPKRTSPFGEPA